MSRVQEAFRRYEQSQDADLSEFEQRAFYAGVESVVLSLRRFLELPRDEQRVILGEERLFEAVSRDADAILSEILALYPDGLQCEGEDDDFDPPRGGIVMFLSVKTGGSPGIMHGRPE